MFEVKDELEAAEVGCLFDTANVRECVLNSQVAAIDFRWSNLQLGKQASRLFYGAVHSAFGVA